MRARGARKAARERAAEPALRGAEALRRLGAELGGPCAGEGAARATNSSYDEAAAGGV